MKIPATTFGMIALALAWATSFMPASAHHSINAQFDVTKLEEMQGVLLKVDNINPHAYWHFDVKGPDGKLETWHIESVAPNALRQAGISMKKDIKPGDTYHFGIAPALNGTNTGLLLEITVNGQDIRLVGE